MTKHWRPFLFIGITISMDCIATYMLGAYSKLGPSIARVVSLGAGLLLCGLVVRLFPQRHDNLAGTGLWPLIVVCIILNYGLFVVLAARAPFVQPLVHLTLAWCASGLFFGLGLLRNRRRRD